MSCIAWVESVHYPIECNKLSQLLWHTDMQLQTTAHMPKYGSILMLLHQWVVAMAGKQKGHNAVDIGWSFCLVCMRGHHSWAFSKSLSLSFLLLVHHLVILSDYVVFRLTSYKHITMQNHHRMTDIQHWQVHHFWCVDTPPAIQLLGNHPQTITHSPSWAFTPWTPVRNY